MLGWLSDIGAAMLGWLSDIGATTSTAVRARIGKSNRAIKRSLQRVGLLPAVVTALAAGLLIAYAAYQIVYRYTPTSDAKAAPIDITKVSLTIVAGVGGVVALVIAYRRQRDAEQGRFVERFGAAAAQLGSIDVAVRIAGVYAMAGAADETDGRRRQQCIDVLCGYLRLPYDPELGANHQSKLVVKRRRTVRDRSQVGAEQEQHLEYRQNDREVRATIVRVIADHLRSWAEYSWSARDFDFRTAHLEDPDFSNTTFSGTTQFGNTTFSGTTQFGYARFSGDAGFGAATFSGTTQFGHVTFSGDARFDSATFSGTTQFGYARFSDGAGFGAATFSGTARFWAATFSGYAQFEGARFSDTTRFDGATFSGDARFGGTTFSGPCVFVNADFGTKSISFADPKQWGPPAPVFDWAQDVTLKPPNVEPHDWPPTAATPPTPAA